MEIKSIVFARILPFAHSRQSHPQDILPPFGIGFTATILKSKGIKVRIIDMLVEDLGPPEIAELIAKDSPDLVILESTSAAQAALKDFASLNKARIWCMGHFASTLPEILLKNNRFIEGCIIGEPEETIIELVDCLNRAGDIRAVNGIAFYDRKEDKIIIIEQRAFIEDLDSLPPIDFRLLKFNKYRVFSAHVPTWRKLRWGFLLTSRGCAYKCIYCSPTLRQSYGANMRANSPEMVVRMMERLISDYKVNAIAFQDDNFSFDKKRTIEICRIIIERRLDIYWVIQARADCLDKETLEWLKRAGCCCIAVGVEAGSERVLKLLKKGQTKAIIRSSFKQIKEAGISGIGFFMIGNPNETHAEIMETFELANELRPQMIQVAFFTPYPGSSFYETLNGKKTELNSVHHYNMLKHNFSNIPDRELRRIHKMFYLRYYFSPRFIARYLRNRAPYAFLNNHEFGLLCRTFKYLLFSAGK